MVGAVTHVSQQGSCFVYGKDEKPELVFSPDRPYNILQKKKKEGSQMAMMNCPECGRPVSDQARDCPNCGGDIQNYVCRLRETQRKTAEEADMRSLLTPGRIVIKLPGIKRSYGTNAKTGEGCFTDSDYHYAFKEFIKGALPIFNKMVKVSYGSPSGPCARVSQREKYAYVEIDHPAKLYMTAYEDSIHTVFFDAVPGHAYEFISRRSGNSEVKLLF